MSANIVNQMPYLRTSREFPEEIKELAFQVNKSYLDVASAVNNRTIGIFPINRPAITGESWYITGNQRQQTLRQVFTFTSTASITHGIKMQDISQFTRCFGTYTDGTNSYGLINGTSVAIAGQISFYVTSTQIVFVVGAGAPPLAPPLGSGRITLEWLSSF